MATRQKKPTVTLASLDESEAKLLKQLEAIKEKREGAKSKEANRIKEVVESFVEQLNSDLTPVTKLSEVSSFIRQVEKGTLGSLVSTSARTYKVLSADDLKTAETLLRDGNLTPEHIAKDLGCSAGRIWTLKTELGLTKRRTPAAPAPVVSPENPPATSEAAPVESATASAPAN